MLAYLPALRLCCSAALLLAHPLPTPAPRLPMLSLAYLPAVRLIALLFRCLLLPLPLPAAALPTAALPTAALLTAQSPTTATPTDSSPDPHDCPKPHCPGPHRPDPHCVQPRTCQKGEKMVRRDTVPSSPASRSQQNRHCGTSGSVDRGVGHGLDAASLVALLVACPFCSSHQLLPFLVLQTTHNCFCFPCPCPCPPQAPPCRCPTLPRPSATPSLQAPILLKLCLQPQPCLALFHHPHTLTMNMAAESMIELTLSMMCERERVRSTIEYCRCSPLVAVRGGGGPI